MPETFSILMQRFAIVRKGVLHVTISYGLVTWGLQLAS